MINLKQTIAATTLLAMSGAAFAADMYIDLGTNAFDLAAPIPSGIGVAQDADSRTGVFQEFGFSGIRATSVYDLSDGSILGGGNFDTNLPADRAALGLGPLPIAERDLDALNPLVPPLSSDNEGFLQTWQLLVEFKAFFTLTPAGPVYTGGFFDVFFDDLIGATDRKVMSGTITGSNLQAANLDLFMDLTFVEAGFLWIDDGTGTFVDASTRDVRLVLDTNVNPPVPTLADLTIQGIPGTPGAVGYRDPNLDGSITAQIPAPHTLALLGLGLLGFAGLRRRA